MPKRSSTQPLSAMARIISSSTRFTRPKAFHCTFRPRRLQLAAELHHLPLAGDEELVLEEEQVHARLRGCRNSISSTMFCGLRL